MRHAEGVRQHGAKPPETLSLLPRGWGAAPSARSTPTRAQRGTRPKKYQKSFTVNHQSTKIGMSFSTFR
ncbi:MAG: hypothetical protein NZ455_02990 [Bacteroidia bacterium]|nr:hypothetical protein [Bacteroidia bacterium]MDW8346897.1 hypothetical protein [Bacteroidia bacterium]